MALRFLVLLSIATISDALFTSALYPSNGNLLIGRESRLSASSTCGALNRERYCDVSNLGEAKKCYWCASNNNTFLRPDLNHGIQNVINEYYPGTRFNSWWQSENGKENVTIQLDMETEYHLEQIIIQFKTFRPKAMLVERSIDFGKTWRVDRYYAHNCADAFPGVPERMPRSFTEVVCESGYSEILPTSGGIVDITLMSGVNSSNSVEAYNFSRMTNLRINFTKLHTLGGDIIDDRSRTDIIEKYYYAIEKMTVLGSCSCNGHSERCLPMPNTASHVEVHGRCECTHNTQGINCEYCDHFYNGLPWKMGVGNQGDSCKRCICNGHAKKCHFDPLVYNSTGKINGGVCDDCEHNTMGVNCERCRPKYYQDPNLDIQDPEICKACDCDIRGVQDKNVMCDEKTDNLYHKIAGRCVCKFNVGGLRCDRCREGFWNFDIANPDGCEECTCNKLGTIKEGGCDPFNNNCFCKRYVGGKNCDQCLPGFYGLADIETGCIPCNCESSGALNMMCDVITGQCKCKPGMAGRRCNLPSLQSHDQNN